MESRRCGGHFKEDTVADGHSASYALRRSQLEGGFVYSSLRDSRGDSFKEDTVGASILPG